MYRFTIEADYYADTGVYVATSEDITGLTLETETVPALIRAINEVVPRLLVNNLKIPAEKLGEVQIDVLLPAERRSNIPLPIDRLGFSLASIGAVAA